MKMRRIALALTAVGMLTAVAMASLPAQAHEWGGQEWRHHAWQEHHDWRVHAPRALPQVIRGFVHHR
jgi:hypothetical protein